MKKKTSLVIMAAGMGSRFGGLKQMAPLGPSGQVIIDYSVYDAVRAGFDKVVLIIKKENEADFREVAGKRIERLCDVSYVFQDPTDLPAGFSLPEGRLKPWGTGHAVLSARREIDTPFAVINADDYYGAESYRLIHECLVSDAPECMVGFELGKTLTESGTVSRGVCTIRDGYLESVVEHTALDKNSGLPLDTVVSMNLWGFSPAIMETLERGFAEFLTAMPDPMKSEFYLPAVVDREIRERGARYRVLRTPERWYGVTYREDAEGVRRAIAEMTAAGKYPAK
ncbi:MAG: NTP transferase domain-containing protein [Clostridia bacterium]|nr:NTP transferase domain-containing protein [Clostridia bacterium]